MHTTNLRKVGGSVMLALPPAILDMLNWLPVQKWVSRSQRRKIGDRAKT